MDRGTGGRRGIEPRKFYNGLTGKFSAWARQQFELREVQGDGATLYDHLRSHAAQTGEFHELLQPINECDGLKHVYEHYFPDINRRRQQVDGGPQRVTYQEILAWCKLRRVTLSDLELDALNAIEPIYIEFSNKALAARKE